MAGFTDPKTLALLGASAGFLDPRGGMMGGFQGAMQGMQSGYDLQDRELIRKRMQDEALQKIQAQEFLQKHQQAGTDPRALIQQAAMSANPFLMQMAGNMAKALPRVKTTEKVMKDGNAFTRPVFDDGTFGDVSDMPVASQMSFQNLGDKTIGVNPYTGQPLAQFAQGITPGQSASLAQSARHHADSMGMQAQSQNIARQNADFDRQLKMLQLDPTFQAERASAIAGGRESGKFKAEAASALPETLGVLAESLNISDTLKNHPALESMVGSLPTRVLGKGLAMYGGNNEADFAAKMEQSQGKQFISAIQSMRGFGSLTEREGDKMQSSAAAMSTAQSPAAFKKAQDDYQAALLSGVRKIAFKMGVPEKDILQMLNKERENLRSDAVSIPPGAGGAAAATDGWGELR